LTDRLPVPRLVAVEPGRLEARARALVAGAGREADDAAGLVHVVAFRLGAVPCAVETSLVERAVVGLSRPLGVPLGGGGERAVVFVEELPLPVADLAGHAAGAPRAAARLEGAPALVITTAGGPVAVAVDGPLDLAEDRLVARQPASDGDGVRIAGRLAGGASLVDAGWLAAWAREAVRS
jgi:hypothetical protein